MFENGLFIFRRDLRIIDNNGLNILSKMVKNIYTIFIFTPANKDPSQTLLKSVFPFIKR